jgi:hypothetical protein
MLRYQLDDLGPYQFEKLVQSALKAAIGLGVESWGNRGDWGRDSYAPGTLRFPDDKLQTKGPFIFQVSLWTERILRDRDPGLPFSPVPRKKRSGSSNALGRILGPNQHTLHLSATRQSVQAPEKKYVPRSAM